MPDSPESSSPGVWLLLLLAVAAIWQSSRGAAALLAPDGLRHPSIGGAAALALDLGLALAVVVGLRRRGG